MALVQDPDFNIMQQSHGLFAIAKLLVYLSNVVNCIGQTKSENVMETLTCCDVATTGQIIMSDVIPQPITSSCARCFICGPVSVIWVCGYPAPAPLSPVDSNTARVKFTRPLAFWH